MADAVLTIANAIELAVVGGVETNSSQDLRDIINSLFVFGGLRTKAGSTDYAQSTTPQLVEFEAIGNTRNVTASLVSHSMTTLSGTGGEGQTTDGAGVYNAVLSLSFTGDAGNYIFQAYVNGVADANLRCERRLGNSSDVESAGFNDDVNLAAGDVVTLRCSRESGVGDFRPIDMTFKITRKG